MARSVLSIPVIIALSLGVGHLLTIFKPQGRFLYEPAGPTVGYLACKQAPRWAPGLNEEGGGHTSC